MSPILVANELGDVVRKARSGVAENARKVQIGLARGVRFFADDVGHVDSLCVLVTVMSMMKLLYVPSFSTSDVKQIVRHRSKRSRKGRGL